MNPPTDSSASGCRGSPPSRSSNCSPAAIVLIAELARSVSHRTQVLFATQSTACLDYLTPEEVVVTERRDGATRLNRLNRDKLTEWLDQYSLSEIFDKGIIGGRP